jgi:hypothetical protein
LGFDLGTASGGFDEDEAAAGAVGADGSFRRELNVEMKSTAWGESPSRLLKCETASGLLRVAA